MRGEWFVSMVIATATMAYCVGTVAADVPKEFFDKMYAALPKEPTVKPSKVAKVLIFEYAPYYHQFIPLSRGMIVEMGKRFKGWECTAGADPNVLKADSINKYDAIVLNNIQGEVSKDADVRSGLISFVKNGGGCFALHCAADCWHSFPEYGEMIGGFFNGHPFQAASVKIDDPKSPLNAAFGGKGYDLKDEIYEFSTPYSREKLHILQSIDTSKTNVGGGKRYDKDYAIAWIHEFGKGRVYYTTIGHFQGPYFDPALLKHWADCMQYVLGDLKADATPSAKPPSAPEPAPAPTASSGEPPAKK